MDQSVNESLDNLLRSISQRARRDVDAIEHGLAYIEGGEVATGVSMIRTQLNAMLALATSTAELAERPY